MPQARPILFSAPMIRALLDGRKTQTRRIIKPQPERQWMEGTGVDWSDYYEGQTKCLWIKEPGGSKEIKCPYGRPGDLLWARETWAMCSRATDLCKIYYRASEDASHTEFHELVPVEKARTIQPSWPKWKPGIHMPRAFSRLTLEITDIRVQRIQQITEVDAVAEGICIPLSRYGCPYVSPKHPDGKARIGLNAVEMFEDLWKAINGSGSWGANPWIWALTLKVHKCNVDAMLSQKAA